MALSKIITASLNDDAVTNAKVGDDIAVGKFITKITANNDATVSFGSSSITDDFDFYDIIINNLRTSANGVNLNCRFGLEGSSGVVTGTNYAVGSREINQINRASGNAFGNNYNIDQSMTFFQLVPPSYLHLIGAGTNMSFDAHYRFHNLRNASVTKTMIHVSKSAVTNPLYATTYGLEGFIASFVESFSNIGAPQNSNKVDEIQFFASFGNIASGTLSLYGIKL